VAHSPTPAAARPRPPPRDPARLRPDQGRSLLNAWAFAEKRGIPLDLHVVIHWDLVGLIAGASVLERQARFLDRLGKWLHRRGRPLAYLWTIEFGPRKGEHTHLLLAGARLCPRGLGRLFRRLPGFLAGRDGANALPRGAIEVARNRIPLPHDPRRFGRVARTPGQRRGLVAYVLKGLDPAAADRIGVHAEDQGQVRCRRCGVARALDWAARRKAGWREQPLEAFDFADLGAKRRLALLRAGAAAVDDPRGRPGAPQGADRPSSPLFPLPPSRSRVLAPPGGLTGVPRRRPSATSATPRPP
jgi:hypothetical protein